MGYPPDVSGAKGMFSHLSLLDKMLGPLVLLAMILGVIIGALLYFASRSVCMVAGTHTQAALPGMSMPY